MSPGPESERWIVVGRIIRAHGLRGELGIRCDAPADSALLTVKQLRIAGETSLRTIAGARAVHSEVLIFLAGVADRTGAEKLKGHDIELPRAALPEPEPGEVYYADLVGLSAVDEAGKSLGKVVGIWETGPVPVIVIGEGKDELLVPFAEQFVVAVEPENARIVIRPPEYDE